jgi:hypothetical protein
MVSKMTTVASDWNKVIRVDHQLMLPKAELLICGAHEQENLGDPLLVRENSLTPGSQSFKMGPHLPHWITTLASQRGIDC